MSSLVSRDSALSIGFKFDRAKFRKLSALIIRFSQNPHLPLMAGCSRLALSSCCVRLGNIIHSAKMSQWGFYHKIVIIILPFLLFHEHQSLKTHSSEWNIFLTGTTGHLVVLLTAVAKCQPHIMSSYTVSVFGNIFISCINTSSCICTAVALSSTRRR